MIDRVVVSARELDTLVEKVNGKHGEPLTPVTVETEYVDGEGSYVYLIYRIQADFEYARLKHRGQLIAARLEPE